MRLELAQTFTVGSDASNGRFPPVCVRQDSAHPTISTVERLTLDTDTLTLERSQNPSY